MKSIIDDILLSIYRNLSKENDAYIEEYKNLLAKKAASIDIEELKKEIFTM